MDVLESILGLNADELNAGQMAVVASQSFDQPGVLVMVVTTSLIGLAVLFPIARALRRRQ